MGVIMNYIVPSKGYFDLFNWLADSGYPVFLGSMLSQWAQSYKQFYQSSISGGKVGQNQQYLTNPSLHTQVSLD
jgi:hypothetical protein